MAKTSTKLSGVGKRLVSPGHGQNKWTYDQRLSLHLMFSEFQLTTANATEVFNTLYAEHLESCGLPEGLATNAIRAQYGEGKKEVIPKVWIAIRAEPTDPEEVARRMRLRDGISGVLGSLRTAPQQYPTPAPSSPVAPIDSTSRKRAKARAVSQIRSYMYDSSEDELQQPPRKRKLSSRQATVVILRNEQHQAQAAQARYEAEDKAVLPRTPKRPKAPNSDATEPYKQASGRVIMLTPKQFEETKADLVPIEADLARLYTPLLFRHWTESSMSPLTEKGFTAGRFSTTIIPPPAPPSLKNFPWSDAQLHFVKENKVHTPFISTSNNAVWIIRLALEQMKKGARGGHISVIDPRALNPKAIFHAQPFHKEICRKRPFEKGEYLYNPMVEFFVWARIPSEAIIQTFPISMLLNYAASNHAVGEVLRLERLSTGKMDYTKNVLPAFIRDNITLTRGTITALANVCKVLGLDSGPVEAVGSLVSDLIKGLGIKMEYKSEREWQTAVCIFSGAICSSDSSLDIRWGMGYAFLDGCRWGLGERNARQKPKHMERLPRKAEKIGLGSPLRILDSALNNARATITKFDQKQRYVLRGASSQALLADRDRDDNSDDEGTSSRLINVEESDSEDEIIVRHTSVRRRLFAQPLRLAYNTNED